MCVPLWRGVMAKKRITRKELVLLNRVEYLVMRDHGHEWERIIVVGFARAMETCIHCRRRQVDYLRASRVGSRFEEVACEYSQT